MFKNVAQAIPFIGTAGFLLLTAGSVAWVEAWVFLALTSGCGLATSFWLKSKNPELFAERTRSPLEYRDRPRDRWISVAIMLAMTAWLVGTALDARRLHWSMVPFWGEIIGAIFLVSAFLGWVSVIKENSFAVAEVRVQRERGQTVVSTGPYAVVRHPMYAYAVLLIVGTSLLLGSYYGILGIFLLMPILGARAVAEEEVLKTGLLGYGNYMAKVRYRFLPGLW